MKKGLGANKPTVSSQQSAANRPQVAQANAIKPQDKTAANQGIWAKREKLYSLEEIRRVLSL